MNFSWEILGEFNRIRIWSLFNLSHCLVGDHILHLEMLWRKFRGKTFSGFRIICGIVTLGEFQREIFFVRWMSQGKIHLGEIFCGINFPLGRGDFKKTFSTQGDPPRTKKSMRNYARINLSSHKNRPRSIFEAESEAKTFWGNFQRGMELSRGNYLVEKLSLGGIFYGGIFRGGIFPGGGDFLGLFEKLSEIK